jgi:YidC/Oxa1 family membrane protein insertase
MDRTAWIVVTICTAGLIAWFVMQPKPPPRSTEDSVVRAATPAADTATIRASPPVEPAEMPATPAIPPAPEKTFVFDDDGVSFQFSTKGGGVKTVTLPPHRFSGATPTVLNEAGLAAIGALCRGVGQIEDAGYELKSPEGKIPIIFERLTPENLLVRKSWTPVAEGAGKGFLWKLAVTFKNQASAPHAGAYSLYAGTASQLHKSEEAVSVCWNADGSAEREDAGWFDGSGFLGMTFRQSSPTLEKSFQQLLWAGVHSQYYTTLIANTQAERDLPAGSIWAEPKPFTLNESGSSTQTKAVSAGVGLPPLDLAPGAEKTFDLEVYMGPRAHSLLSKLGRRFSEVMSYWPFGFISKPMLWVLVQLQRLMSFSGASWGLAVILLTLLVRGLLWPLTLKSTRQMKRMSLLAPQMKELQLKYKDDPQKMNAQVMGLYKKYGVNPISGCLPMLLQIPIFFGLYTMLRYAVELRGHGFWWVTDLAMPDTQFYLWGLPINPLPLVMAATMFVQMAMTPKSPDPNMQAQQRIFLLMPFFFLFMCYSFAAALALYWTVSNIIGIFQSWVVKRMPEPELIERPAGPDVGPGGGGGSSVPKKGGPRGGGGGKPSFMEIFAQRLTEHQKQSQARSAKRASGPSRTGGSRGSALKKPGER